MIRYAMILKNRVIEVLERDGEPNWPPDPSGNPVTAVECDETVQQGMEYDPETGAFAFPEPKEPEPTPAPEPTQLDRIEALAETAAADNAELMAFYEAVTAEVEA